MGSSKYSQIRGLLETSDFPALGPEKREGALSESQIARELERINWSELPEKHREIVRGLVYFWHDHLDKAHSISQDEKSSEGSMLHAFVHRREPDFANSKYWFHRVGNHPVLTHMGPKAIEILGAADRTDLQKNLVSKLQWHPAAFVDFCAELRQSESGGAGEAIARQLQAAEAKVFLEWLLSESASR